MIYDTIVEIRDGEHEYQQHHYSNAKDAIEAEIMTKQFYGLNHRPDFKPTQRDDHGKVIAWEEEHDYRIYKIEGTYEAKICVDGISSALNLSELAGRPVLPLFSKDADWTWGLNGAVAYWWDMGDMVVEVLDDPVRLSSEDSRISILYWHFFSVGEQIKAKQTTGWELLRGRINE
jgi:hypothetical protein